MDVFISWTSADRDVKNLLVEKLQAANISFWDSDEECTSDYSSECIAAIRHSSVFIVIVSDASMEKGYVLNEVIAARKQEGNGRLNILVYKITDAPYTNAFDFQLNHISMVTGNLILHKENLNGQSSLDIIVRRTEKLLAARKSGNPEKPFDVNMPQVEGLVLTKTGYFVEHSRDDILDAMDSAFQNSNVLVLREFFGYGKRSTIRKFVERNRQKITNAVYINNAQADLRAVFMTELNFTNINPACFDSLEGDALIAAKLRFLEKLDESTLLVLADVDCNLPPDAVLCQQLLALKCRIILLTQDTAEDYADWFPVIRVGRMENAYLTELFFHHYTRAFDEEKAKLLKPLAEFFDRIGGHTKTVELTASVLNRDLGVLPEDLTSYLSPDYGEGLQLQDRILGQISHMFDMEQLTPEQNTALLVGACLAVPHMPERTFRSILRTCGVADYNLIFELDRRRWLDLDLSNHTVSIEPLVAQIIYRKFSEDYEVLTACLDYLSDAVSRTSLAATNGAFLHTTSKVAHFLRLVGLALPAHIVSLMRTYLSDGKTQDCELLTQALSQFGKEFPSVPLYVLEDSVQEDEELSDNLRFQMQVLIFFRSTILPLCQFIARNTQQLLVRTSHSSLSITPASIPAFSIEELFGVHMDEFYDWLYTLREQLESDDELDTDEQENFLIMELLNIVHALTNRQGRDVHRSLMQLLEYLFAYPEFLASPDNLDMLVAMVACICTTYINAESYSAALLLCEQVLALCDGLTVAPRLLSLYIIALRCSGMVDDALFDTYQTLLDCYEKDGSKYFDDRNELLKEKCSLLLDYAYDLATGGKYEKAKEVFAGGWERQYPHLLDKAVSVLYHITQQLIKAGTFVDAKAFLSQHFTGSFSSLAESSAKDNTRQYAAELNSILQFDPSAFEKEENSDQYISYYHKFPRLNNTVLDRKYFSVADRAAQFDFSQLTNEQIMLHSQKLRQQATMQSPLDLAPEAFALASEAGYRVLGYRHHYVQYIGAAVMADGKIAEIFNGEGKTYTIVLTAYLQSLYGGRIFVVDESHYLTQRNYTWMQGVYTLLGVDCRLAKDNRTLENLTPGVCYTTVRHLVYSYLNAELVPHSKQTVQLDCLIVDEADMVLVDEAQQRFVYSNTEKDLYTLNWCMLAYKLLPSLKGKKHLYTYKDNHVIFSPDIYPLLEEHFHMEWGDLENLEKTRRIEQLVHIAIKAGIHYELGKHYFIHNGIPVYEKTEKGIFDRFLPECEYFLCMRHNLDPHPAMQALTRRSKPIDLISIRDLFRKSRCVCGTTATAASFRKEFAEIYGLEYVAVPPHKPCIRQEHPAVVYMNVQTKLRAILALVSQKHQAGQPVLLCTQSVEESELYSRLLSQAELPHKLLNARNADDSAGLIAFAGVSGSILVANALTGRGADIKLGGNPEQMTRRELLEMGVDITGLDKLLYALPTPEIAQNNLYKRYFSILEKNRLLCAQDRQTVLAAGGLCVITTSFFQEARNEQQAIGRSGRQGEPGESYVMLSIEDKTLAPLLSPTILQRMRITEDLDEGIDAKYLSTSIKFAQKRLHNATFAKIRVQNSLSTYVDIARPDFMDRQFALAEILQSRNEPLKPWLYDTFLKPWTADKNILKQLQSLQKGTQDCDSAALRQLWKQYDVLKQAKGFKTTRVFSRLLQDILEETPLSENTAALVLQRALRTNWIKYIQFANELYEQPNLSEDLIQRSLTQEKQRLLRDAVEQMLLILCEAPDAAALKQWYKKYQ